MLGHRTLNLQDYIDIARRRGWIVLIPLVFFPIAAYFYSLTIHPMYLSQTLVLIEGQQVPDNYVKPVITSGLDSRLASMKEQILSRSHLQPILERYNLFGSIHVDMDERIDSIRKNIEVKPIASGFYISFKADDPHTAQSVCSDVTSLFLEENLKLREASAEGTTQFLKSQLEDAKRNLDEQDAKLAAFQRQYFGRLPGDEGSNSNVLSSLNTQLEAANQALTRMEQDKSYQQTMLTQQLQVASTPGAVATPALQESYENQLRALQAEETDLLNHYTGDHPDVIAVRRKMADLRRKISQAPAATTTSDSKSSKSGSSETAGVRQLRAQIQSTELGIQEKRKEQAKLQSSISTYQERLLSSPDVAARFKELTRDYQTAQAFYDELLSKMNQSKMATDLEKRQQGEQFRVMDAANLPEAPYYPKRIVFVIGGLAIGLMIGLAIVALLEYRDTSIRSERDLWAFTKLPTLGIIAFADVTHVPDPRPGKTVFGFRKRNKQVSA